MLQTNNTGMCSQCLSHTGSAPTHGACSLPAHTARALGCSTGNHLRPALGFLHFPGPSHSGSGTRVVLRGADSHLGLRFVPFPDLSSSGDQVLGERSCPQLKAVSYRLLHFSCSVFWVYNRCAFSGVVCVSSGELISGCNPPSECQPSRIPGSLG